MGINKQPKHVAGAHATAETPAKTKRKSSVWDWVFRIAITVFVVSVVALGVIVFQYLSQQRAYSELESNVSVSDTQGVNLESLSADWDALRAINPNIVGWIYVPDTPINYPIVQGKDNEEYLHKSFAGETGWLASAGTIFLDADNTPDFSDQNNALYGHHMNDGSMFASVADWENQEDFNAHRDIYILTPQGNYHLKTFALVVTTGSDLLVQTSFVPAEKYLSYISDKINRSVVSQEGTVLTASDVKQSVMLSTCEYTRSDGRAVAFASVVETTNSADKWVQSTSHANMSLNNDQALAIG